MFDIGMPEFMLIAVVALVVLGPERFPVVMRRVGQVYRQARELMTQYSTEAQRMFEEGMREVEDVGTTINSALQTAMTDTPPDQPPPKLRQLPPPVQAPLSAADAGPWMLPASYRDGVTDPQPVPAGVQTSPFSLARQTTVARVVDDWPAMVDLPDDMGPAGIPPAPATGSPNGAVAALSAVAPTSDGAAPVPPPVAPTSPNGPYSTTGRAGRWAAGDSGSPAGGLPEPEGTVREQTVIDLYLQGGISWQKAAEFLGLAPAEFLDRLARTRAARAGSSQQG